MTLKQQRRSMTRFLCSCAAFCSVTAVQYLMMLQEGEHDDADCSRRIGVRTSTGITMLHVSRGLDCSGTAPPPNSFFLGSHAEATHLKLRETLANHLHEQNLQHLQRVASRRSAAVSGANV